MKKQSIIKWLWLGIVACTLTTTLSSQNDTISLEEALAIASSKYAGLERDALAVGRYNKLAAEGLPAQPTQLYLSGEEFGSNGQTGVHSINVQQNFYLPKASRAQQAFYRENAALAGQQLVLTEQALERSVKKAYYQLLYAKEALSLTEENGRLYDDFLSVTTAQLEAGETGKLPRMAARSRVGQANIEKEYARNQYQIALASFNSWLQSDTLYQATGTLSTPALPPDDAQATENPHLRLIQARQKVATAKVETQKAQLLPQINTGAKLQSAFGNFPLFGYQLGVNMPLFKKGYQSRIEAAQVEVLEQKAAMKTEQQKIKRITNELRSRLAHQLKIMEYLEQDLAPLVEERTAVNLQAYREGEVSYLEYLDSLEQALEIKQQFLDALHRYQVLKVELDYWIGR